MSPLLLRLGERVYRSAPALYRSAYAAYKAWSDRVERRLLAARLQPGMTVVDVGANIGVYSRFLARRVGPTGLVFAFEPESVNFEMLVRAARRFPQIRCRKAAVCDRSGTLPLFLSDGLNVDHHSYDSADGRASVPVDGVALDDLFGPTDTVHFIKIDVQGAEMAALKGAERILRANERIELLFEYWPYGLKRAGTSGEELLSFLRELGFDCVDVNEHPIGELKSMAVAPLIYTNVYARRTGY